MKHEKPRKVMSAQERRDYILKHGAAIAEAVGLRNVTPKMISHNCEVNCSVMTIRYYFNSHEVLREAIANSKFASKDVKSQLIA